MPKTPTSNPVQHQRQMQMQRSHFSVGEDSDRTQQLTLCQNPELEQPLQDECDMFSGIHKLFTSMG